MDRRSGSRSTATRPDARTVLAPALAAALAVAVSVLSVVAAAALPASGPRITVTADTMDVDTVTRTVAATGHVRVTDGTVTGTASKATLYHAQGRGILVGNARITAPQGVLVGGEITFTYTTRTVTRIVSRGDAGLEMSIGRLSGGTITVTPPSDSVVAEENVTFLSPPDVVATARRLSFDRGRGRAVLDGGARLQNRDGFIQGERIEGVDRLERASVTGGVIGRYRDIDARSQTAEYDAKEKKIVFIGDAEVTQAGRRLFTERVTVWYAAGRIVAEGATRVRIEPTP